MAVVILLKNGQEIKNRSSEVKPVDVFKSMSTEPGAVVTIVEGGEVNGFVLCSEIAAVYKLEVDAQ